MDREAAARAEAMNYKLRKEAFVSNLSGSSVLDINLVTQVAPVAILLWATLSKTAFLEDWTKSALYLIDFLLNICGPLFAFTIYSDYPLFLISTICMPVILLSVLNNTPSISKQRVKETRAQKSASNKTEHESQTIIQRGTLIVRPFLTNYRGAMLIQTVIAILAVDFRIFPRRFAKVETWGTSLMDLGVGSFVFSAGIVGARAVIREQQSQNGKNIKVLSRLAGSLRHSIPLIVLGVARLISVKNLDYAEHVTEYGVHWNFFFTLGLLPPFVEAVDSCLALLRTSQTSQGKPSHRSVRYDVVAMLIIVSYELILNNTGLLSFILIAPRTTDSSLLVKNREGIFSFYGYLAIFLSGRSTGILTCQFQLADEPDKATKKWKPALDRELANIEHECYRIVWPEVSIRAVVFALLYLLTTNVYAVNLTVSRRLANLPYVLWILAYNNAQLAFLAFYDLVGPKFVFSKFTGNLKDGLGRSIWRVNEVSSPILRAFNKNGLALFLLANLGTGLVNLTVNTLDASNAKAMVVLLVYCGGLAAIALALDKFGVSIKL